MFSRPLARALLLAAIAVGAAVPAASQGSTGDTEARCLEALRTTLDQGGYSHELLRVEAIRGRSVVDETLRLQAESGAEVVLLTDGRRLHIAAPFLSYRQARELARDGGVESFCELLELVGQASMQRRRQRLGMAALALVALAGFGAGVFRLRRLERP